MYRGSMVGSGAMVFAVWGYVIANADPCREFGTTVELNPKLLGPILGENVRDVEKAIEFLCSPDPETTTPDHQGRRLIRQGQFLFQVVNGSKYRAIRDEIQRKEQNKEAAAKYRAKKIPKRGKPLPMENAFAEAEGDEAEQERILASVERKGAADLTE